MKKEKKKTLWFFMMLTFNVYEINNLGIFDLIKEVLYVLSFISLLFVYFWVISYVQ